MGAARRTVLRRVLALSVAGLFVVTVVGVGSTPRLAAAALHGPAGAVRSAGLLVGLPRFSRGVEGNADVSVTGDTPTLENEPSVAVNPADPSHLVVGVQHQDGPCSYYRSVDGGATWSAPIVAPLLPGGTLCYDISVRASPDGRYFYLSYLSLHGSPLVDDVAVLRLSGNFSSTAGPFVGIHQRQAIIDKDWIDVHEVDPNQANQVYLTATYFTPRGKCKMLFARSSDYGQHWSKAAGLATYSGCTFDIPGRLGARAIGGFGQNVLVCWYDTGTDGWGPANGGGGAFNIACRSSADDGATFGPLFLAVSHETNELPRQYCPRATYQRIWPAMFPSMSIAPDGSAHITYTTDPTSGVADGECGDIRYVRSLGPPYNTWTAPVTIAGGPMAQTFPAVVATTGSGGSCDLHVAYLDGQQSPSTQPNLFYDVYRVESSDCGQTWSAPVRVTDTSSISQTDFIGDYIDITATPAGEVHVVWTDRRDETGVDQTESDVYTDHWRP